MKLVVAMSVDAYAEQLERLFATHHVPVFSEMEMEGFRLKETGGLTANWFGASQTPVYSKLAFAFVEADKADALLTTVADYNHKHDLDCPIRAFQMHVEKSI